MNFKAKLKSKLTKKHQACANSNPTFKKKNLTNEIKIKLVNLKFKKGFLNKKCILSINLEFQKNGAT